MKKILVVDDEIDLVETISFYLTQQNFQVITAHNGIDGIEKAKSEKPDLILLDIMMPVMDGLTACRQLKSNNDCKNIPVIMLTAKGGSRDVKEAIVSGAIDYVVKPFDFEHLTSRVIKALDANPPKKKILIVDDEEDIVETIKFALEVKGFQCITAFDGLDGLNKAQNENPDLILLDIMLPRLGGYEVCRKLKFNKKYQHIPVFMLTAKSLKSDVLLAKKSGASKFINKPFELDDLVDLIIRYLASIPK